MTDFPLAFGDSSREQNPMTALVLRLPETVPQGAMTLPQPKENDMQIGSFKSSGVGYAGTLETLAGKFELTLEPNRSDKANTPDFRVFHGLRDVGYGYKETSEGGVDYISIKIDDPIRHVHRVCRATADGRGLPPSQRRAQRRPIIRSTPRAPDQPIDRPRLHHWTIDLAAPRRCHSRKRATIFIRFRELLAKR
jgi:uncharacterized protein (DUF736 family)